MNFKSWGLMNITDYALNAYLRIQLSVRMRDWDYRYATGINFMVSHKDEVSRILKATYGNYLCILV